MKNRRSYLEQYLDCTDEKLTRSKKRLEKQIELYLCFPTSNLNKNLLKNLRTELSVVVSEIEWRRMFKNKSNV